MKFLFVNFFILIFLVTMISISIINSAKLTNDSSNKTKIIQCKICQFSFKFNFNYDKLLEDSNSINIIKKFFVNTIDNDELESFFKKDNIENLSKEVSMQFFFKGSENQFMGKNFLDYSDCKENKKERSFCDDLRLRLCDEILGNEKLCPNIGQYLVKSDKTSANEIQKLQDIVSTKLQKKSFLQSSIVTNTVPQNSNLNDILQNLQQLNFKQIHPNQRNNNKNQIKNYYNKKNELNNKNEGFPNNINFLQLTPNYINRNLSSKPKAHWRPPKPVLLQNFENSITDQLKDIGFLTTYLRHLIIVK